MKVIATQTGFYKGIRRRPGSQFEFDLKDGKNGELPKWVVEATDKNAAAHKDAVKAEIAKNRAAVEAAAGPKRPGVTAVRDDPVGTDLV